MPDERFVQKMDELVKRLSSDKSRSRSTALEAAQTLVIGLLSYGNNYMCVLLLNSSLFSLYFCLFIFFITVKTSLLIGSD